MRFWYKKLRSLARMIATSSLLIFLISAAQPAGAQTPVVHLVLFYSPTCAHCHLVMTEVLPPLQAQYGPQLEILEIDATQEAGRNLFMSVVELFRLKRAVVPLLIIGDTALSGSVDIPNQLPGLIEQSLSQGGVDWPALPNLDPFLPSEVQPVSSPVTNTTGLSSSAPSGELEQTGDVTTPQRFKANFLKDPITNSIAVAILIAMLVSVIAVLVIVLGSGEASESLAWLTRTPGFHLAIPVLCALGLFVAGYLTYVEVTDNSAVCGPLGDCNAVQKSSYATLLGFLPVGVLGLLGYLAILFAWAIQNYGPQSLRYLSTLSAWGMALFGVFFSIYLTFLEPFVIGASCAWCLSSAILITVIMWSATPAAQQALNGEELELKRA